MLPTAVDPMLLNQPLFESPTSIDVNVKTEPEDESSLVEDVVSITSPTLVISPRFSISSNSETQFINPQIAFQTPLAITIPQTLSAIVSPLFEENPAYSHLYSHFIRDTCRVLVPYDDHNNPFRTILAQLALQPSAQHLLAALLASSAAHRAGMKGEPPPVHLISSLLQTTLQGLRKALADPTDASQDTTLATAIALSSYNIIASDVQHWRMHLDGAREIILHRRRMGANGQESSIRTFLSKWFAYLDVIAGASGLTLKEHDYGSAVKLIEDVTESPPKNSWEPSQFDTFTGFTERLLPLLLRIGKLAHQKRVAQHVHIDLSHDHEFMENLDTLERDLNAAEANTIVLPNDIKIDAILEQQLRACNDAFHAAARIHIQRRLRNMTSDEVKPTVEKAVHAIQLVPVGSGPEISLLYPLFSAGVEATGTFRDFATYRMEQMEKIGIGNVQRAKKVMLETWRRSDLNGSVNWEDVMEGMGWDLSLA
jgi:Fungal specific transcription factor domain